MGGKNQVSYYIITISTISALSNPMFANFSHQSVLSFIFNVRAGTGYKNEI
jgi:hypothetical protein